MYSIRRIAAPLILAIALPGCGGKGKGGSSEDDYNGPELFGVPALANVEETRGAVESLLPAGLGELRLGMSRKEAAASRAKHYRDETVEGPDRSMIELHGKDAPLDRVEIAFDGAGSGLSEIWVRSEWGTAPRAQFADLAMALVEVYGEPSWVFPLKGGRDIGMQWVKHERSAMLVFNADPVHRPTIDFWIEDAEELGKNTPLNNLIKLEKRKAPADLAGYIEGFLAKAFAE